MTYEFWHDFAGPISTVIASVVAVLVTIHFGRTQARIAAEQTRTAKQQAELARIRLQHDLYDRRIEIFGAVRDLLLTEFSPTNTISQPALGKFIKKTRDSAFIFDDEMSAYLDEIVTKAMRLGTLNRRWHEDSASGVDQTEREREIDDLFLWFSRQYPLVVCKFKKVISLETRDIR